MIPIWDRSIGFIDIRNQAVDESLAEAGACFGIPVTVIGEDDDKGLSFSGTKQFVDYFHSAESNPLIGGVGLSVQEIENRITLIRLFIVTGWEVDGIFLVRLSGCDRP